MISSKRKWSNALRGGSMTWMVIHIWSETKFIVLIFILQIAFQNFYFILIVPGITKHCKTQKIPLQNADNPPAAASVFLLHVYISIHKTFWLLHFFPFVTKISYKKWSSATELRVDC